MSVLVKILIIFLSITTSRANAGIVSPLSLYDFDSRQEVYELSEHNSIKKLSSAVGGLAYANQIKSDASRPGWVSLNFKTAGERYKLCSNVKYQEQPSSLFCSAFLVAPDLVMTAGHCIKNKNDCHDLRFVLDYANTSKFLQHEQNQVPETSVLSCKEILFASDDDDTDVALFRIDKTILDRETLKLSSKQISAALSKVNLVGHGLGLPLKISWPADIFYADEVRFRSYVPAFIRSSGSPLLNYLSGEVVGILVDGDDDFEMTQAGCNKLKICHDPTLCLGEEALQTYRFQDLLKRF